MPSPTRVLPAALAALLLATPQAAAAAFAPVCGEAPAVYRGENERWGWILRAGVARDGRAGDHRVHLYDAVFEGGEGYLLYGTTPARLRLTTEPAAHLRAVDWFDDAGGLPRRFQLVGDDGTAGPVFRFARCEPGEPPARRAVGREFWE